MDPELARCQLESQKAVAAIEKQSWEKVEAALVVEVAATATTGCKAIETIEKNKGKWQQADILAVLGKFVGDCDGPGAVLADYPARVSKVRLPAPVCDLG